MKIYGYRMASIGLLATSLLFLGSMHGLDNKKEILLNAQKNPFITPCIKIENFQNTDNCSYCHETFHVGERVTIIDECQHLIHTNCIQFTGENQACPHEACNATILQHNYAACLEHMKDRPDQHAQFNNLLSTIISNNKACFPEYTSFFIVANQSSRTNIAPYRNILFKKESLSLLLMSFKNTLYYFAQSLPLFYLVDNSKSDINIDFQAIKEISKSDFHKKSGEFYKAILSSNIETNIDKFFDIEKIKYSIFDNIFYSMLFHLINIEMIINHSTYKKHLHQGINLPGRAVDGVANIYRFLTHRQPTKHRQFLNTENLSIQEKEELSNLLKNFFENYIIGYGLSKKAFFFPFIVGMYTGLTGMLWAPMINYYYINNTILSGAGIYALGKSIWDNFNKLRKRNANTGELQAWSIFKKFIIGSNRNQDETLPLEENTQEQPRPSLFNQVISCFRL